MEAITQLSYALDTFYFLVSGALVMWMAAGFAMLEAGLVRAKNTAEILTKNVALFAIACIMYMLMGYNIMYPGDGNGYFPALDLGFMFGGDNSVEDVLASNGETYYSGMSDFFFQVVFVATAMSIVSGAVAERMKLWAFLLFAVVMTGVIYPLQGYWKWGGGFLDAAGFSDFAGSGVVHLCGAAAALAGVILLGARKGKYTADGRVNAIPGANLPLATLGTFILWLGWFGFNGGSELKISDIGEANAVAAVFVNTNAAAAGGVVAALLTARALFGKADLTMALNGALAGLVAITAEPLTPVPLEATLIGAVGGLLVVFSIITMDKIKIDDPVGAISVHGVVGMWGLIAVPLTNSDASIGPQLLGLGVIFAWTFVASLVVWLILKIVMGIRVSEEEEYEGVDLGECGLEAYPEFTGNRGSGL
ncbi:MAG: ammonium transporter [Candidatus Thiodiazotropha sp. (ex Lucina aurantia)]|uniref:Ammonium transporter n=2 Tax=Candidatus Thiodiazotropha TaxID=1913444 RepID=A0A7Z1AGK1_9GAMM|nr:ammonium transporter [Candidatus Thiodiazotropha endolucinida]MBT3011002.1 ammonium transporter [Candidatus Thiodiazotropha sp. (ex Lucina pensylvanica)]MBT3014633.1 ammonium transporter [Candidatus Thiodiazotropha taylori]MBT3037520.1 ammonium transporter [Candidatus Thiodiazotropha sp. (ex Codakia orbicularis)]MBV2101683.1 ammonium transporter [Candidatus Thiodiazotropha sp. (ex Lucina aurantia)]MBT3022608.1 ammonium transporter [Candidatus Thiodiazotropha taylori]